MARPIPDSPARRLLMQGIMWIILGGTVALAAAVGHYKRSAFEVKLDPPTTYRGISVQLPRGWEIKKGSNPQSSVLLEATEPANADAEEGEGGGRVVRIVREPIPSNRSPLEFAGARLGSGGKNSASARTNDTITINGQPGVMLYQIRVTVPKALQELIGAAGGVGEAKTIVLATVAPSGRGIAVELEGEGMVEAHDLDLVKRLASTLKFADEPALIEGGQVDVGSEIHVPVPSGFATIRVDDPLQTARVLRSTDGKTALRTIALLPAVLLPRDGSATVITMLSLYDPNHFEDAQVRREADGVWRIEPEAIIQRNLPMRAYAITKNGASLLVILRGGEDNGWMDGAWQAVREKSSFAESSNTEELAASGAEEVARLRETGLARLLPESMEERYWLYCVNGPEQPVGWWHFTPGATGGKYENRYLFENSLHQITYEWRGTMDLKSCYVKSDYLFSDLRDSDAASRELRGLTANFKSGKIELSPRGGGSTGRAINYTTPPNYLPGAWLPLIMSRLGDRPIIVRSESFIDYAYARSTDLLTLTFRPQRDARPAGADENAPAMKCVSLEVSGSGERSRWYYRTDGTLDTVEYQYAQRLIRRNRNELSMDFSHNEPMRP